MEHIEYGGIVKVSNSLRKYYGLETYHETDPVMDEWLDTNHFRCVVTILIDALGTSVLEKHLKKDSFFLSHTKENIMTVFPPTTSAATTSFRTGKNPAETGWLGWNQYFKEKDDNLILFYSRSQYEPRTQYDTDFSYRTLPVLFLEDELREAGILADSIWPEWSEHNPSSTVKQMEQNIVGLSNIKDMRYLYAYWDVLDSYMHRNGPSAEGTGKMVRFLDEMAEHLSEELPKDTGMCIIADHSQVDIESIHLDNYPELVECFLHKPALEARTVAFYIKEEKKAFFVQRFNELFSHSFHLYTHAEVIKEHLFGEGKLNPRFEEFIGDYLAVCIDNKQFLYENTRHYKGDHAGGMKEETEIPVILFP